MRWRIRTAPFVAVVCSTAVEGQFIGVSGFRFLNHLRGKLAEGGSAYQPKTSVNGRKLGIAVRLHKSWDCVKRCKLT